MTYLTKEEFDQNIEGYMKIYEAAEHLADAYVSEFGGGYVTGFEIEYDGVFGTLQIDAEESYCSCCSPDYNSYNIPLSFIFDDNWIEKEKEKREEKIRKQEAEKAKKKTERRKEIEKERYQKYLRMKEEYESK